MKGLKTFPRGGIHPHGRKNLTNKKEVVTAAIPETLTVPMHSILVRQQKLWSRLEMM